MFIRRLMRETCISIKGSNQTGQYSYGQIKCKKDKSVNVQRIWLDNERNCEYETSKKKEIFNERLPITCDSFSSCKVPFYRSYVNRNYTYLNLRFYCTVRITCPANNVVMIDDIWDDSINCPAYKYPPKKMTNTKKTLYNLCNESPNCSMIYSSPIDMVTSIFYHCKGGTEILRNNSGNLVLTTVTDSNMRNTYGGPNYAVIVGGIIGVLLVICIIVGVFLLRRRKCITKLIATHDSTHGHSVPDNYQEPHLMNSPDAIHVSTLHAVNMDNTTNEDSNTYSHLRNTVDDSDVMYDHTIRHNVHYTCDGDYGITHRRVTEDDYDVFGNYRQSLTNKADPVYN